MPKDFVQPNPVACTACGYKPVSIRASTCPNCHEPDPAYLKFPDGKLGRTVAKKAWDETQERDRIAEQKRKKKEYEEWAQSAEGKIQLERQRRMEQAEKVSEGITEFCGAGGSAAIILGIMVAVFSGITSYFTDGDYGSTTCGISIMVAIVGVPLRIIAYFRGYVPPPPTPSDGGF